MDLRHRHIRRVIRYGASDTEEDIYLDDSAHDIEVYAGSDAQLEEQNHNGRK